MTPSIGPERRRALLAAARACLRGGPGASRDEPAEDSRPPVSVFVTLRSGGELRGCIGVLETPCTLVEAVEHSASSAAKDPRFPPVTPEELPGIRIEISVLGGWRKITGPEEIRIGHEGVLVSQGGRRGLLLPQVAVEQEWGARVFLDQACIKAGLPRDAWAKGAEVRAFTAEVFSEAGPESPGPAGDPAT